MLSSLGACAATHLGRGPLCQRPADRPAVDTSEHESLPQLKSLPHARCTGKYSSRPARRHVISAHAAMARTPRRSTRPRPALLALRRLAHPVPPPQPGTRCARPPPDPVTRAGPQPAALRAD
eukprot:5503744-Prymnesium_polylepis.1